MSHDEVYAEIARMRELTYKITDTVNNRNLSDITDVVESLNEEEAKTVLKMVLLGEWKRLMS